jgi:hypothetical protein
MEKIRVAVRVRPAVTVSEDTTINGTCRKVEENCISLHKSHGTILLSPASLMPLVPDYILQIFLSISLFISVFYSLDSFW